MRRGLFLVLPVSLAAFCSCRPAEAARGQSAAEPAATQPVSTQPAATQPATLSPAQRARRVADLHVRSVELAEAGKWAECIPVLEQILQLDPGNETAWYNMACVHARLGRADRAVEHLNAALRHGYSDFRHMERDPDLASLRPLPGYRQLLARNAEIQRDRAEKIRDALRKRFGEGYIVRIDHANKLVFATNIDRQTLSELTDHLTAYAEAMWNDLFGHRFEQYVTIVIPSGGEGILASRPVAGYYRHDERMLVAGQIGMVLNHEFTHALHDADQDGLGQRHPIWISEGLATLFESSRVQDGRVEPEPNPRLNLLKRFVARKQAIPWKRLFSYDRRQFMRRALVGYPQAGYVLMYLRQKGLLKKWYDAYTAGFEEDPTGAKAVEKVFGKPLEQVEADWLAWVERQPAPPLRIEPDQAYIGIAVSGQTDGLRIRRVVPGSGAEDAGLKAGDVIVQIDGRRIVDASALMQLVSGHEVGEKLEVRFRRDGRYETRTVTLKPMPADVARPQPTTAPRRPRTTTRPAPASRPAPPATAPGKKAA